MTGRSVQYTNYIVFYNSVDEYHRVDGPAIEYADGSKAWFINGKLHREDGPAIEWEDGDKEWFINDVNITIEVNEWRKEMGITNVYFTKEESVLFRLYFGNR